MADKKAKSQAEKAAQARKSKSGASSKASQNSKTKKAANDQEEKLIVPLRLITSLICLALFVLFLVIFLQPDGALVKLFQGFVLGLIGWTGFYVAIPALLYLFTIQAFSGKRPILLRSVCLIVFVLLCGCISQLGMGEAALPGGFSLLVALFQGGSAGTTAGLLCGGVALLLQWLCGKVIAYIVLIMGALFTLLASFQITIPSVIRAVQNRPRADWEDEVEEVAEPAAVVVNHLANKRIEYVENKRRIREEQAQIDIPLDEEKPGKRKISRKASELMSQIDSDVEMPVAAAKNSVTDDAEVDLILEAKPAVKPANTIDVEPVQPEMLPFEKEEHDPLDQQIKVFAEPAAQPKQTKVTAKEAQESAAQVAAEIAQTESAEWVEYCFPPIDLLKTSPYGAQDGTMEMRENTRRLNETLMSFKIEAHIINVTRGPSVTRYEVELDKGVRLNKLTTCADDIALSLGASGVRIAAVPGKISVVGIEVPNRAVTTVSLREVIDSNEFNKARSKSSFAVGKDIGGSCIVGNIAKLPHMLIAGTTGSGKSVCMNSIIISLLYKASPVDVKLIMVDPKMVELGIYNGIPHLLIPVVTDPKKAAGSLQWAVTEMMRR